MAVEYSTALKNALLTHHSDPNMFVDVKQVLDFTAKTLARTYTTIENALNGVCDIDISSKQNAVSAVAPASAAALEPLSQVIHKVSCELQCKCSGDYASTISILEILKNYSWDAKVAIAIAAFAMNYGEFCALAQLYLAYPLAKCVATIKHLPDLTAQASIHRPTFNSIKELMENIVALANFMVRFNDLDRKYVSEDRVPLLNAMNIIHEPAYCIIFGIVVCNRHIANIAGFATSTFHQIESWNTNVTSALESLQRHFSVCELYIDEEIRKESIKMIRQMFEKDTQQEEILRVFFNWDVSALIDCSGKEVKWKKILQKTVLILISSLDICLEEINALSSYYRKWQAQSVQSTEVLWFPILEDGSSWNNKNLQKFNQLRASMPWCTIKNPSHFKPEVISYIKQAWKFSGRTNLVSIDSSGKLQGKSGLDTLWMWGDKVSYFTKYEEKALWEKAKNLSTVEIVFGGIDSSIDFNSVKAGNTMLCFYGGEDIVWIQKFSIAAKNIARRLFKLEQNVDVSSKLKLIYVGKSSAAGKVKENISKINVNKISQSWSESSIWLFWSRLKSILYSNGRIDKGLQQRLASDIINLLSFDSNEDGWAVFCYGSGDRLTRANGYDVLNIFDTWVKEKYEWKEPSQFLPELGTKLQTGNRMQCNRLFIDYEIPGGLVCYCTRSMKKSYIYTCCHKD